MDRLTLVDTSAWVHAMRSNGDPNVAGTVRALMRSNEAAWCDVVRLELWNGARGDLEIKTLQEMEQILPNLPILPEVWARAIMTARKARGAGRTVPVTDHLIKACAHVHGVDLLHADRHFDHIRD